ncbi:transcriptional regulator domain-containing protein [Sphingobium scionense]
MPTASDWRSQAIAAETADLDYADFAQEFLRHNKEYRRQYARYAARRNGASSKETLSTGFARRWGWCFPIDPDVSAAVSPALWRPEVAPGPLPWRLRRVAWRSGGGLHQNDWA